MQRKKISSKILLLIWLLFIISACSPQNTPNPVYMVLTSSIDPPLTPRADITPTALPIHQFTSTPSPSQTTTLLLTTRTVPIDFKVTLTEEAVGLRTFQTTSFPITCKSDIDIEYHSTLSPDGNWLAISCSDNSNSTLEIVNITGKRWELRYEDYVANEFKGGRGSLNPIHWPNEDYLYFTSDPGISVWGPCLYFGRRSLGLYRINLHTGNVSATLPPLANPDYKIAFSPNGRNLAYIGEWSHTSILDLRTGEEEPVEMKDDYVGNLTWSPDGSKLAYASCQTDQDYSTLVKSSINIYFLDSHLSKTILEEEGKLLGIDVEDANPFLKVAEGQYPNEPTYYWFYDWSSGQIIIPDQMETPSS